MPGLVDSITGALDHASGSVDEAIGRQFDSQSGGGIADTGPVVTGSTGVFSPSLFLSSLTFGAIDQEVFQSAGADSVTTIDEVGKTLNSSEQSGRSLATMLRLVAGTIVVGAVVIALGQLFEIQIGDQTA